MNFNENIFFLALIFFLSHGIAIAQERTVGLMLNDSGACPGYTLFAPLSNTTTYLINNEGELVHSWESSYYPGTPVYLGQDGYLNRSISIIDTSGVFGSFGGGVEKIDWDGKVVWHYKYVSDKHRSHHDIGVLPNGNVLLIAWESKDTAELVAAGRNPALLPPAVLLLEQIVEVKPVDDTAGAIVWEWHAWDHLVQEFDSTKDNYGLVADHPELINLNYIGGDPTSDWIHLNAVSYNETFDQLLLTSRLFEEVWIIDHSTTTEEARGHTGGRFGKGGDLLYRWGNPRAYGHGTVDDRKLFVPHDGNWIKAGLPGAGHILIFNNGIGRGDTSYSSVDEVVLPVDGQGNYSGGLPWGPEAPVWTYGAHSLDFFAGILGSAERQPNGTTLVCESTDGTFFEITPAGKAVWRYVNPVGRNGPVYQGDSITMNSVFKIRRYSADYPGLVGRDLTPKGPIEKYFIAEENRSRNRGALRLSPTISRHAVAITYELEAAGPVQLKIFNSLGQETKSLVDEFKPAGAHTVLWDGTDNRGWKMANQVYFVVLTARGEKIVKKVALL